MLPSPPLVGLAGELTLALGLELAELGIHPLPLPLGSVVGQAEDTAQPHLAPDVVVLTASVTITPTGGADTAPLADAAEAVGRHLRPGQLVLVSGQVPPGITRRVVGPALTKHGPGSGVAVAYTPDLPSTGPRVVGGLDAPAGAAAAAVFARLARGVRLVSSAETAEVCATAREVICTIQNATATELHRVWEQMGVDSREVAAAVQLPGFHPHRPSSEAALLLAWGGRRYRTSARLLAAAVEVNAGVADALVERVAGALNTGGRPVAGSHVVVVCAPEEGTAHPVAGLVHLLLARGAVVRIHDHSTHFAFDSTASGQCVLLLSDPPPSWVATTAQCVVDAR